MAEEGFRGVLLSDILRRYTSMPNLSQRPVACRLYPPISTGGRLKADPLCPGFNKKKGQTFKQYLRTQEVGAHVKKVMGKI